MTFLKQENEHNLHNLSVVDLTLEDIPDFLSLQAKVSDIQRHKGRLNYFKERQWEDLTHHLEARMPLLGVRSPHGDLLAQCLIAYPDNPKAINLQAYPLRQPEHTAVLQSFLALPGSKSGEQTNVLLDYAKKIVADENRNLIVIQINAANKGVIRNMCHRNGFKIYDHGFEPQLKQDVVYMEYNLLPD